MHTLKLALNKSMRASDDEKGINKLWTKRWVVMFKFFHKKIETIPIFVDEHYNFSLLTNKKFLIFCQN